MKRFFLLPLLLVSSLLLILSACSQNDEYCFAKQYVMRGVLVDIGADGVYIGDFFIGTPTVADSEPVSQVHVVHLGNLADDALDNFILCPKQVQTVASSIEGTDDPRIVVFSLISKAGTTLGHSISHNPVWNARSSECYTVHLAMHVRHNY